MKIINSNGKEINYSLMSFSGGERHIQLENLNPTTASVITLQARISCSDELMDLLLLENALRNKYGKDLKLNLELPYLPYARQDRVCAPGQAFSLEVIANLLKSLRLNKMVTWDCHSPIGLELTGAINVDPADIIATDPELLALLQSPNSVLICPDKGAVKRCSDIKQQLNINEIVFCEKQRDPSTGQILKTDVLVDDLSGKCAIITDDICDGGYTFIRIAEQLRDKNVKKIVLFVTHGIFSKGLEVFDNLIDEIITTNSFSQNKHPKLRVIPFNYDFGYGFKNNFESEFNNEKGE